ncbi:MAG: fibronectin type III domain-containing protein, partial [Actinobacteria bacterium]|nr:fibronectin type III domain-containing protein [Actinomycetota bacterium]
MVSSGRWVAALVVLAWTPVVSAQQEVALVPRGAVWRYLDDGSDQETAWRQPGFQDLTWRAGSAQLGYGDGDEATVVSYGPFAIAKYITTYFRRSFPVANPRDHVRLRLRILRDDGAVVYLNGVEVVRSNILPFLEVEQGTPAFDDVSGDDEDEFHEFAVSPALLRAGSNVLAVEIHQSSQFSSDIGFDLELIGDTRTALVRSPYLQRGTATGLTVRWRTDAPTTGSVRYGLAPGSLDSIAEETAASSDHAVTLAGLTPDTRYYYAVGHGSIVLAGGDADHSFVTAPVPGTPKPTRVWVLGDSGTADARAAAVRDAYLGFAGERHTDLWLMLGDNAYDSGTDAEYQAAVFD